MSDIFAYNVKELITNYGRKKYKPWGQKELDYYHGGGSNWKRHHALSKFNMYFNDFVMHAYLGFRFRMPVANVIKNNGSILRLQEAVVSTT